MKKQKSWSQYFVKDRKKKKKSVNFVTIPIILLTNFCTYKLHSFKRDSCHENFLFY